LKRHERETQPVLAACKQSASDHERAVLGHRLHEPCLASQQGTAERREAGVDLPTTVFKGERGDGLYAPPRSFGDGTAVSHETGSSPPWPLETGVACSVPALLLG